MADAGLTAPITNVKMTENKTVYAGWEATAVPDMLDGTGHYIYAVGYADGTIRPNANISRLSCHHFLSIAEIGHSR